MRASALLLAIVDFIAAGLQAIPLSNLQIQTWLVHLGVIFNNIGAPVAMGLGPLISAVWFPPDQRAASTAIASLAPYVGTGLAFIIGPLLAPDVGNHSSTIGKSINYIKLRNNMIHKQLTYLKDQVMHLMYIEFAAAALIFLVIIVYFPTKPKLPPSVTATVHRLDFRHGFKRLMHNKQFWLVLFINGSPLCLVWLGVHFRHEFVSVWCWRKNCWLAWIWCLNGWNSSGNFSVHVSFMLHIFQ